MASSPSPPDPRETASAQGAANRSAAEASGIANNYNVYGPDGSTEYRAVGTEYITDENGRRVPITRYGQYTTLSDDQQQLYNTNVQTQQALGQLGLDQTNRVSQYMSQPFQTSTDYPLLPQNVSYQRQIDINGTGAVPTGSMSFMSQEPVPNYPEGTQNPSGPSSGPAPAPPQPAEPSGPGGYPPTGQPTGGAPTGQPTVGRSTGRSFSKQSMSALSDRLMQGGLTTTSMQGGPTLNPAVLKANNPDAPVASGPQRSTGKPNTQPPQLPPSATAVPPMVNRPQVTGNVDGRGVQRGIDSGSQGILSNVNTTQMQRDLGPQMELASRGAYDAGQGVERGINPQNFDRRTFEDQLLARTNEDESRERSQLDNQLRNQGILPGTEAYDDAMSLQSRQLTDARTQAYLASGQEQSRQADLAFRGADLNNQAQNQQFQQGMQQSGFQNQTAGQAFNQDFARQQFRNDAADRAFGQDVTAGEFNNRAQGQAFGQDLSAAQFGNQSQQQAFGQGLTEAELNNQALQNQASTQSQLYNQVLNRDLALRNQPLNEIIALLSGSQVSMPNVPGVNTQAIGAAPVGQYMYNNYNQQAQNANSFNQGLFGLGSAFLGG